MAKSGTKTDGTRGDATLNKGLQDVGRFLPAGIYQNKRRPTMKGSAYQHKQSQSSRPQTIVSSAEP